jgi:hypothetical protein
MSADEMGTSQDKLTWASRAFPIGRRLLVVFAAFGTVYVAVGSALYGGWWYGLIWEAGWLEWRYIRHGLFFLFDNHFFATIVSIVGAFTFAALILRFAARMFVKIVDGFWGWILSGSLVVLCITAIADRRYFQSDYDESAFSEEDQKPSLPGPLGVPVLTAPIEFKFLDEQEIAALYSQITPEYVGKERSIEETRTAGAKAGVAAGPLSAETKREQASQVKSTEERVEFTSQRKAIDTINYCLQEHRCRYYSTADGWLVYREVVWSENYVQELLNLGQQKDSSPDSKEFRGLVAQNSPEARDRRRAGNLRSLEEELGHDRGLVLIDGEYSIRRVGAHVVLAYAFLDKPPTQFVVTVPTLSHLDGLGQKSFFRVFASVDEPLRNGVVSLHALAVY